MKREKPTSLSSNEKSVKPSKKLKVRITSDDQSPSEAGHSKEVSNTPISPSGDVKKIDVGGKTSEAAKSTDDQNPSDVGKSTEVSKLEATKNISDDRSPADAGQSKELEDLIMYCSSAAVSTPSKSHMAPPPTDPITVTIEENVNATLERDDLKCSFEVHGTLSLQLLNRNAGFIELQIEREDSEILEEIFKSPDLDRDITPGVGCSWLWFKT
ncbi:coatomer subunit delta [Artemisia annua]|uniref:Coatomer subunit delta n=1 Tax=Artemisia annua TaxID=35608 RepID=A0A2U1QNE5_ARTAN|nr:coatomer subunit delta [Artemisia annua]